MTTETQIKELRNEAGAAGDCGMIAICDQALEGCKESIKDCAHGDYIGGHRTEKKTGVYLPAVGCSLSRYGPAGR